MSVKVIDRDNGYGLVLRNVKRMGKRVVKVGVNEEPHEGSDLTNAQLGAIHEFGLGHVPERSFLRAWFDQDQGTWLNRLKTLARDFLFGGRESYALRFGEYAVAGIRARIRQGIPPALDEGTVRRKGSATPLIDTEQLINAIEFEVGGGR